jgi:hypothetical protein
MNDTLKPWQLVVLIPLGLLSVLVCAASLGLVLEALWDRVPSSGLPAAREGQMRKGHEAASDCLRFMIAKILHPPGENRPIPDWPGLDAEEWLWEQRVGLCTKWSTIIRIIGKE